MDWKPHGYRVGAHSEWWDNISTDPDALELFCSSSRKRIEPWLSAVFQSEHLSLLLGSGFTSAIAAQAGAPATGMGMVTFDTRWDELINEHATASAVAAGRGTSNWTCPGLVDTAVKG